MNARSCERVGGFQVILRGYMTMLSELAGNQWNEGDVSCSVVRRVALPDAFFAMDGMFETFLTVLDEFGAFPAMIDRELERYLPFLASTKVLMACVRAGVGREEAHEVIKEHAVGSALDMREKGAEQSLVERLAADDRIPLDEEGLRAALADRHAFIGAAGRRSTGSSRGSTRSSTSTRRPPPTRRATSSRPGTGPGSGVVRALRLGYSSITPHSARSPASPVFKVSASGPSSAYRSGMLA